MSRSPKEAKLEVGQRTLSFFTQTREKTQEDTSTELRKKMHMNLMVISIQVSEDKNVRSQSETQTESETRPTKTDKMTSKQIATIFKKKYYH